MMEFWWPFWFWLNVMFYSVGLAQQADNGLCTWISLCPHLVTVARSADGDSKPISAAPFAILESLRKGRPASSLLVETHPRMDRSSLPELSAHCCFSLTLMLFTHISEEVDYSTAVYTNRPTALLSLSCPPGCIFVWEEKNLLWITC